MMNISDATHVSILPVSRSKWMNIIKKISKIYRTPSKIRKIVTAFLGGNTMIQVDNLSKSYGKKMALDHITASIHDEHMFSVCIGTK